MVVADDDGVAEGVADTDDDADSDTEGDSDTDGEAEGEVVLTALGLIARLSFADADVPAVAVTVTEKEPDSVGVPLIVPAELIESPAGSPVAVHVAVPVPPVATTVAL